MRQLPILVLLAAPLAAAPTFSAGRHRPNDIAPMSLVDFQSARPLAER
jgi:hypothetical protein